MKIESDIFEFHGIWKKLDQRKKIEKEMKSYQKRIAYLSKVLKAVQG